MFITVKGRVKSEEDIETFNELNIWCAKSAVSITSVFNVQDVEITMTGDDMVLANMMAHLKEKQYDVEI